MNLVADNDFAPRITATTAWEEDSFQRMEMNPALVEDIGVTIFLLPKRMQESKAAFGHLWVDQLHLAVGTATAT